jgi:hypothetical protein
MNLSKRLEQPISFYAMCYAPYTESSNQLSRFFHPSQTIATFGFNVLNHSLPLEVTKSLSRDSYHKKVLHPGFLR